MKKILFAIYTLALTTTLWAVNPDIRFYWFHVQFEATEGGSIYVTGDWRLPQGDDDFGSSVTTQWVIAGRDNSSSCYGWAKADEGYLFAGWYGQNGKQLLTTDSVEARIWATTDVAQDEDGIVSGNRFYALIPSDTVRAVFVPINPTALDEQEADDSNEPTYDIMGRIIRTSQNGQIIIRGRRKILVR